MTQHPQEQEDPHASKIDPTDPRLKIRKPAGRSLRKGPVIAIISAVLGVILIAVTFALQPVPERKQARLEENLVIRENGVPDFIRNAPDNSDPVTINAPVPTEVPKLGRKLPGDLGSAMVQTTYFQGDRPSPEEQEYEKALASGPFFSASPTAQFAQGMHDGGSMMSAYADRMAEARQAASLANPFGDGDQNKQQRKNDFLAGEGARSDAYVSGTMTRPVSPYEVKAGSIIPVSLITGINSDLPGEIIGQVRENVYDTVTGEYLLIPQGSRLMASYDSMVSYGQKRALVCWNRLIRPDGSSMALDCMPGVDLEGYAGFTDKVDNHYDRLIGGVVLSSVLSLGATTSQGEWSGSDDISTSQMLAANVGDEISSTGRQITRKNLNIQPTIKVRPGYSVNVLVNKDMVVPPYYMN